MVGLDARTRTPPLTPHTLHTPHCSHSQVVELLDDLFQRAASADEPPEMNYVRKHSAVMMSKVGYTTHGFYMFHMYAPGRTRGVS